MRPNSRRSARYLARMPEAEHLEICDVELLRETTSNFT